MMAYEIDIRIGSTGSTSEVRIDGKLVPVSRYEISGKLGSPVTIDITLVKVAGVGISNSEEPERIQGYLVDWEEYRGFKSWSIRHESAQP